MTSFPKETITEDRHFMPLIALLIQIDESLTKLRQKMRKNAKKRKGDGDF